MVALRVALTPPIEPHYAEQLLTTALETAHGTSLSDAMTIAACERFEDATRRDRGVGATRRARRRAGRARARRRPGEGERRRRGDGTINQSAAAARTPETHPLRPFGGFGAGLW